MTFADDQLRRTFAAQLGMLAESERLAVRVGSEAAAAVCFCALVAEGGSVDAAIDGIRELLDLDDDRVCVYAVLALAKAADLTALAYREMSVASARPPVDLAPDTSPAAQDRPSN